MFPELSRFDRVGLDTETTGLTYEDRPVGMSLALPDGRSFYFAWGHPTENNCSLTQVKDWAERELMHPGLKLVFHNAGFDMRMLAYTGMRPFASYHEAMRCEWHDTGIMIYLLDNTRRKFGLDALGHEFLGRGKDEQVLNEWCAARFGGQPTRKAQAKHYSKAPGTIVAEYAKPDAEITLGVYDVLAEKIRQPVTSSGFYAGHTLEGIYNVERRLLPLLLKMHLVGVRASREKAQAVQDKLNEQLVGLKERWHTLAGDCNFVSSKQLAPLFDRYGLPYGTTKLGAPSITKEVIADLADESELCQVLGPLRKLTKLGDQYVQAYVVDNISDDDCIHGEFHPVKTDHYGTISGRFSSGGALNLQNFPAREDVWAPLVRGLLVPWSKDHQWLKCDYNSIEYRLFAAYAGGDMAKAYVDNPDVDFHQWVADITGLPRKRAKNVNFGKLYGSGLEKSALTMGTDVETAREVVQTYDEKIPQAKRLYNLVMDKVSKDAWVITWGGRLRRWRRFGRRVDKAHSGLNGLLQGSAADLIKYAMVEISRIVDWDECLLHLTVHDELDFSVPLGERGRRWKTDIKRLMEQFDLGSVSPDGQRVPIIAECEFGPDWGHANSKTSLERRSEPEIATGADSRLRHEGKW